MGRAPKGNENVFQPSIFRCQLAVSFREGNLRSKTPRHSHPMPRNLHFAHLGTIDLARRKTSSPAGKSKMRISARIFQSTFTVLWGSMRFEKTYENIMNYQKISWNYHEISENIMKLSFWNIIHEISWPASTVQQPDAISIAKVPSSPCARMTSIQAGRCWTKNRGGFPPQIIPFVHRVFHYFHHLFWGKSTIFASTSKEVIQHHGNIHGNRESTFPPVGPPRNSRP